LARPLSFAERWHGELMDGSQVRTMRVSRVRAALAAAACGTVLLAGPAAYAQSPAPQASSEPAVQGTEPPVLRQAPEAPPRPLGAKVKRWVEFQSVSMDVRTRSLEDSAGRTAHTLQYRPVIRAKVKADAAGRLALHLGAFSGGSFTSGWNHTGVGPNPYAGDFAVKHLFVAAAPVKGVDVHVGSLGPFEGETTEITGWDNDVYFTGTRLVLAQPRWLYFDRVAVTRAYVGDFRTPSAFGRLDRFDEPNMTAVFVAKRIGVASLSGSYVNDRGTDLLFQAVTVRTKALPVVDTLRVEHYVRIDPHADVGFAVIGERALTPRVKVGGGWADIDPRRSGLNGDRYDKGRRLIGTGSVRLTKELTLSWFYTHGVANDYFVSNRQRAEVILSYNALPWLTRHHLQ
jgi:hypothetical protein